MTSHATNVTAAAPTPSAAAVSSQPCRPQLIRDEDGTFHAIVFAPSARECLDIKADTYVDLCLRLEQISLPRPLPYDQEPAVWKVINQQPRDGVLSFNAIDDIVSKVRYKGWRFELSIDALPAPERLAGYDGRIILRIEFEARDAYSPDGKPVKQYGRPWLLEPRSPSELLQTIWLAIITAEEHEARERFTYAGQRIFNPHKNHQLAVSI